MLTPAWGRPCCVTMAKFSASLSLPVLSRLLAPELPAPSHENMGAARLESGLALLWAHQGHAEVSLL